MDGAVCYIEEFGGDVTFPECLETEIFVVIAKLAVADDAYMTFGRGKFTVTPSS